MSGSDTSLLFKASEDFLRRRNFDACRELVIQSPQYHPGNLAAAQILTVVDVLSADAGTRWNNARPDYYSILSLNRFTDDPDLIRVRFKQLISLLNPNRNTLSLANEAFSIVLEAYATLSNPSKKAQFDNELRIFLSKRPRLGEKRGPAFWTICPYCYYVYEYPRVYKDCCLRCHNQGCNKGFTAVEIRSPPPPAVVNSGQYLCLGFRPIGFKGEKGLGFSSWMPFSPIFEANGDGNDSYDDEIAGVNRKTGETEGPILGKSAMKRRKSVAICSKKIMGKGIRVQRENINLEFSNGVDDTFAGLQNGI